MSLCLAGNQYITSVAYIGYKLCIVVNDSASLHLYNVPVILMLMKTVCPYNLHI